MRPATRASVGVRVTSLGVALVLAVAAPVAAQPESDEWSTLPPNDWTRLPTNGEIVQTDRYGLIEGVWGCVHFDVYDAWGAWYEGVTGGTPETAFCGYLEVFPYGPPEGVVESAPWKCWESPKILVYTEPFNRGVCRFGDTFGNMTEVEVTADGVEEARSELLDYLALLAIHPDTAAEVAALGLELENPFEAEAPGPELENPFEAEAPPGAEGRSYAIPMGAAVAGVVLLGVLARYLRGRRARASSRPDDNLTRAPSAPRVTMTAGPGTQTITTDGPARSIGVHMAIRAPAEHVLTRAEWSAES